MSLPLTKAVLEELAELRLAEAEHLFGVGHYSGAYYLGGYAVEMALKACIADTFRPSTIPDRRFVDKIFTHNLTVLIDSAGLKASRNARSEADHVFAQHWEVVRQWSEEARYVIVGAEKASALVGALRDEDHGVFAWICSHW